MAYDDIRVGDDVSAYGAGTNTARLIGKVVKVSRVNVQVYMRIRFAPDGPWYEQTHKVPREAVTAVFRDGAFVYGGPETMKRNGEGDRCRKLAEDATGYQCMRWAGHGGAHKFEDIPWNVDRHLTDAMHRFPAGARVLVDGRDEAIVKACFPEGSTSYMFPHYKLDFVDGDKNVAVSVKRVGVDYKKVRSNPTMDYSRPDMTVEEFDEALRHGKYTSVGSYPLFFLTSDGEALSFETARAEAEQIREAIRDHDSSGWRVVAVDVNWENPALYDDHSGERIESAYAEDDAEKEKPMEPNDRRSKIRSLVREHFMELMPADLQKLYGVAMADLHGGPFRSDDAEEQLGMEDYSYQTALRKLDGWWDEYGGTVFVDMQTETVSESAPEAEDGDEPDWSEIVEVQSHEAKRIVFGVLISEGGMQPNAGGGGALGTAPSLEGIGQVIKAFYGGETKELRPAGENTWTVHRVNGDAIASVIVRLRKGRYRFERASEPTRPNPGDGSEWRKRQIILEPELVTELSQWHAGQNDPIYALSSWGAEHLVSLSMIDAALASFQDVEKEAASSPTKLREELAHVVGELEQVRQFWRESSAQESGMDTSADDFTWEYDKRDYGLSPEDEAAIATRSG